MLLCDSPQKRETVSHWNVSKLKQINENPEKAKECFSAVRRDNMRFHFQLPHIIHPGSPESLGIHHRTQIQDEKPSTCIEPSLLPLVSYGNGRKGPRVLNEPITMLSRKESGRTESSAEPGLFCCRHGDLGESNCEQMNQDNRGVETAFPICSA